MGSLLRRNNARALLGLIACVAGLIGLMPTAALASEPPPHTPGEEPAGHEGNTYTLTPSGNGSGMTPADGLPTACSLSGYAEYEKTDNFYVALNECDEVVAEAEAEVCPEEYEEGKWRVLSNYCVENTRSNTDYALAESYRYCAVGRKYRAWVWAWAENYSGGAGYTWALTGEIGCEGA